MDEQDELRRKLRFRAWHRGTREADLILGPFAERNLAGYGPEQLQAFDAFLEASDPDIYDWLTDKKDPPEGPLTAVVAALRQFIAERKR